MASRARLLAPLTLAALGAGAALSLARVFDGSGFVLPVLGAALIPFAIGAFGRHRGWATAVTVAVSLLGLAVYVVYTLEPSTTTTGAPLGDTWRAISRQLDHGWHTLRTTPAPAPVTDGAVLLAVIATWLMALISDWLAFVRRAVLGALAPALVLFVWSSTLGTKDDWELSVAAFAVLSGCFLSAQNLALLDRRRSWLVTRGATRAPSLLPTAIVAVVAVLGALVLAPAIPGAGADPILDFDTANGTQAGGKSYRASIAPLVDVGDKLRNIDIPDLFTVQSPRPDYWRVTALDEYSAEGGGQWTLNAAGEGKVKVGLPSTVPTNAVRQVYTINRLGERWLPAAYRPVSITLSDTLVVVSSWTLVTSEASVEGLTYTVGSVIGATADQVTDAQQAATAVAVPRALEQYTALPPGFPSDITTLAAQIVSKAGAVTPFAKAKALRDYFRDGSFTYDTSIDLGDDANAIETFLRQRRGFCVQFASAYAVMARAVGLPTRLAVGYTPGTKNGDVYTVSSHDAHAWPEVWLAGLGWTHLFDPTPATGNALGAGGSGLPAEIPVTPIANTGSQPQATIPPQPTTPPGSGAPSGTGHEQRHRRHDSGGRGRWHDGTVDCSADPALGVDDCRVRQLRVDARRARHRRHPAHRRRVRRDGRRAEASTARAPSRRRSHAGGAGRMGRSARPPPRSPPARRSCAHTARARAHHRDAHDAGDRASDASAAPRTYTTTRYGDRPPERDDARQAWESVDELERALDEPLSFRERWRRRLDPSTLRVPSGSRRE